MSDSRALKASSNLRHIVGFGIKQAIAPLFIVFSASCLSLLAGSKAQAATTTFEGTFTGTSPVCAPENFCTGLGTSTFSFGDADESSFPVSLQFLPAPSYAERPTGDFLIGTLRIVNGIIFQDSALGVDTSPTSRIGIINLSLKALTNGVFNAGDEGVFRLAYESTSNLDPDRRSPNNADRVFFPDFPEFGTVSILEGDTRDSTTYNVGILARFGSIQPAGFQALPNNANGFVTPIPTPALLPGLIGMGLQTWRKRRSRQSVRG